MEQEGTYTFHFRLVTDADGKNGTDMHYCEASPWDKAWGKVRYVNGSMKVSCDAWGDLTVNVSAGTKSHAELFSTLSGV